MSDSNRLEVEIELDERPAVQAAGRFNAAMQKTQAVTVEVSRAAGGALAGMTQGVVSAANGFNAMHDAALNMKQAAESVLALGAATAVAATQGNNLINVYRGVRFALSPSIFTGFTLALGAAAEASMELAYARGKLIEQDAILAVKNDLSIQSIEELAGASRLAGKDSGYLLGALLSIEKHMDSLGGQRALGTLGIPAELRDSATPELLAAVGTALDGIMDPAQRADLAFKLFGDDAAKYLPEVNHSIAENIARVNEWGMVIGGDRATEIGMWKRNVDAIRQDLKSLTSEFKAAWEGAKNFLAGMAAWVGNRAIVGAGIAGRMVTGGMPNAFGVPDYSQLYAMLFSDKEYEKMLAGDQARFEGARRAMDREALGEIFSTQAQGEIDRYHQSREGVQAALSAAQARRSEAVSAFEREGRGEISLTSAQHFQYGQQLTSSSQQVAALERQVKAFQDADEAARKAADSVRQFHDAVQRLGDVQLSDALEMIRGAGFWAPDKNKSRIEGIQTSAAQSDIEMGLRNYAFGRLPENFGQIPSQGRGDDRGLGITMANLEKDRTHADELRIASLERERRMTEQLIQLRTGPGGEAQAIEQSYQLRLDYAQREYDINRRTMGDTLAGERQAEQIDEARIDRITEMAQLERRHFDEMKQSAEGLIDAVFTRSRSILDSLKGMVTATFLTPIKDAAASWIAAMMMPLRYGGPGGAGALGGLFGFGGSAFGQMANAVGGPGGTSGFSGPIDAWGGLNNVQNASYADRAISLLGGSLGGGSSAGWGSAMKGAAPALGALGGILAAQYSFGLASSGHNPALRALGVAGTFAGATLAGGAIGTLIAPGLGTIVGLGIGAAAGLIGGLIGFFRQSATEKAHQKIKDIYGVDIQSKSILQQIVEMAKQSFGGDLDVAIRSQQIRDIVQLYAMSTGQPTKGMSATMNPLGLVQTGGSLYQSPGYQNGTALPGLGGLPFLDSISAGTPSGGGLGTTVFNLQIDSQAVGSVVVSNGRVVARGAISAMKANSGRRELTSLQLSPGLLTS